MRTLVLLLLLVGLLGGAAWWLLRDAGPGEGPEDEDPFGNRTPEVAAPPAVPGRPEVVVLPEEPAEAAVAVLAAGQDVPDAQPDAAALERLHEVRLGEASARLGGAELLAAVGRAVRVRIRRESDLRALEALGADPEWPPGDTLPLVEVVEHWRRAGFEVELRGSVLFVTQPDE